MTHGGFDATITLNDHHLAKAGLTAHADAAVAAVRRAVETMDGAGWIGVAAQSYPPELPGWVILYPRGRGGTPDTPAWHELRCKVEAVVSAALLAAGAAL
jgi:hypothetical protein